jgi:hypothetical protein
MTLHFMVIATDPVFVHGTVGRHKVGHYEGEDLVTPDWGKAEEIRAKLAYINPDVVYTVVSALLP